MRKETNLFIAITLVVFLLAAAFARNLVWSTEAVLWTDVAAKNPGKARAFVNLCSYYSARALNDHALPYCDKAIEMNSGQKDYIIVDAYINRGAIYSDRGQFEKAMADYIAASSLSPNNWRVYNNIAKVQAKQGRVIDALNTYSLALSINPNYELAYMNRGVIQSHLKNYAAAIEDFSLAVALNPKNADAFARRGLASENKGDRLTALQDYRNACFLGSRDGCSGAQRLEKTR